MIKKRTESLLKIAISCYIIAGFIWFIFGLKVVAGYLIGCGIMLAFLNHYFNFHINKEKT